MVRTLRKTCPGVSVSPLAFSVRVSRWGGRDSGLLTKVGGGACIHSCTVINKQ